jgi:hypothetical protein
MIHRLFQSKFKNHFVVVSMAMFNCSSCSNACDFYERTVTAGCLLLALAMLNVVSPSAPQATRQPEFVPPLLHPLLASPTKVLTRPLCN